MIIKFYTGSDKKPISAENYTTCRETVLNNIEYLIRNTSNRSLIAVGKCEECDDTGDDDYCTGCAINNTTSYTEFLYTNWLINSILKETNLPEINEHFVYHAQTHLSFNTKDVYQIHAYLGVLREILFAIEDGMLLQNEQTVSQNASNKPQNNFIYNPRNIANAGIRSNTSLYAISRYLYNEWGGIKSNENGAINNLMRFHPTKWYEFVRDHNMRESLINIRYTALNTLVFYGAMCAGDAKPTPMDIKIKSTDLIIPRYITNENRVYLCKVMQHMPVFSSKGLIKETPGICGKRFPINDDLVNASKWL